MRTTVPDSKRFRGFPARLAADFEALTQAAIAILQRHPGIERDRFLLKLGFEPIRSGKSRPKVSHHGQRALNQLQAEGVIRLQEPTAIRETVLVYPAGYQRRSEPCDRAVDLLTVQTWVDPTLIGAWQPANTSGKRTFQTQRQRA